MNSFTYQAISGNAFSPPIGSVSARTLSAGLVELVNLTACGTFLGTGVVGILYNAPLSTTTELSSFSSIPSTVFSAHNGSVFRVNNAFNNQSMAILLADGGSVPFTALSSASTVVLSALSAASNVSFDTSYPETSRKAHLGLF